MYTPEDFMKKALSLAQKAFDIGEVPVGALIVKDGKIIAAAYNVIEKTGSVLGHAEIQAIKKASAKIGNWRLNGCDLYVTLEPCPMCAGAIVNARIEQLYYGASDDKASSSSILQSGAYNHKTACHPGILKDDCQKLLKAFFKKLRD
ncbi:MAG: nucleoside deaminase [Clostridiales bacterium]|jgi:tRNA(adenine34) deaminase|nr:nucleoside deaminase [Clostridiales bacterium]